MMPWSTTEFAGGAAIDGLLPFSPTGPIAGIVEVDGCDCGCCVLAAPCIHKAMHIERPTNFSRVRTNLNSIFQLLCKVAQDVVGLIAPQGGWSEEDHCYRQHCSSNQRAPHYAPIAAVTEGHVDPEQCRHHQSNRHHENKAFEWQSRLLVLGSFLRC